MEALDPSQFATLFEFNRAQGLAANGFATANSNAVPVYTVPSTPGSVGDATVIELQSVRAELAAMRREQRDLNIKNVDYNRKAQETLRGWDVVGLPPERTA